MEGPEGRYQDQERRKTPVYISLKKERISRSIEIVPGLGTKNASRAVRRTSTANPMGGTDETLTAMTDYLTDDRYKHVEVTLSIQVATGQILHPNDMVNWIRDLPLLAKSVRLHAIVPSMSTLLILSLPVPTWNLLPSDPACSFIGFTTTMNLLLPHFYGHISGWLDGVADHASSAQSPTTIDSVFSTSQKASSFTTAYSDISHERVPSINRAISRSEGREEPQTHKASDVYTAPSKSTERPSIESALPHSRNRQPTENKTLDPRFRFIGRPEASKFWVPGRVGIPHHFLRSNLLYVVSHDCLGIQDDLY